MEHDDKFPTIKRELIDKIQIAILKIDDMHREVREHGKIINGDPLTKTRGVVERINSLEDSHMVKQRWTMAIGGSVVVLIIKSVFEFLNHPK